MARKSGFVRRHGSMRRESLWLFISPATATLAAGASAAILNALNAAALALRPFTIVRTRGIWQVTSDQDIATENAIASLAYAVVSDQAVGIGVTAVPTPETDRGSDLFFVYETQMTEFLLKDATGTQNFGVTARYDSKAMRKVEDGQDIVTVVENTTLVATGSIVINAARMLIKLH